MLAKAGHGTKKMEVGDATVDRAFPFGPSSIQKMIATKLSLSDDELRHCEALWSRCKLDILSGKQLAGTANQIGDLEAWNLKRNRRQAGWLARGPEKRTET